MCTENIKTLLQTKTELDTLFWNTIDDDQTSNYRKLKLLYRSRIQGGKGLELLRDFMPQQTTDPQIRSLYNRMQADSNKTNENGVSILSGLFYGLIDNKRHNQGWDTETKNILTNLTASALSYIEQEKSSPNKYEAENRAFLAITQYLHNNMITGITSANTSQEEKYYECYRFYGGEKGRIQKSFLRISPTQEDSWVGSFGSYTRAGEGTKGDRCISQGISFKLGDRVYCIGKTSVKSDEPSASNHVDALKVISIGGFIDGGNKRTRKGLILSVNGTKDPIASRLLLKETTKSSDQECKNIGIYSPINLPKKDSTQEDSYKLDRLDEKDLEAITNNITTEDYGILNMFSREH